MTFCDVLEFLSQVSKFFYQLLLLILFSFDFVFFYFYFWKKRDIKEVQKYIFILIFNEGGLRKTNGVNLRWVK